MIIKLNMKRIDVKFEQSNHYDELNLKNVKDILDRR